MLPLNLNIKPLPNKRFQRLTSITKPSSKSKTSQKTPTIFQQMEKRRQVEIYDKAIKEVKKTYSPENTLILLDFIIHSFLANENVNSLLLKPSIKKEVKLFNKLQEFAVHFSKIVDDVEIIEKQDENEVANIMDSVSYLISNIAFFKVENDLGIHSVIDDFKEDKEAIGSIVDSINEANQVKLFDQALDTKQQTTKDILELIVNLLIVDYKVDKFVNIQGYNVDDIRNFNFQLFNLLLPIAEKGLRENFGIIHEGNLLCYYSDITSKFNGINVSAKLEFVKIFKAYKADKEHLINSITHLKQTKKMEQINQLTALHAQAQTEAEAFYTKGNKAAGTRLRKVMMDIKKLTDEIRKDVQAIKNEEK